MRPTRLGTNAARAVGWVILGLVGFGLVGAVRSCRQVSYTAAQALDSLEAIRDTLRVQRVVLRGTTDTLQVWQRRAVQAELKRDALDQALRATRRLQAVVTVTTRPLDTVLTGVSDTDESDSVRTAEFVGYDPPYRLAARVWIPRPPTPPSMALRLGLDPIPLRIRVFCGPKNRYGFRPAFLGVLKPDWATLAMDSITQAPEVCNPRPRGVPKWLVALGAGLGFLVGAIF